jgi:hypothetical protein
MAFLAKFSVSQSVNGSVITIVDLTNYGDGGAFHKTDFVSRTLYITRGDTLEEDEIDFPYTNMNDNLQDQYQFSQDQDYVYSIKMILVDNAAVEYTYVTTVITTEFTNQKIREILGDIANCGCNGDCKLAQKMQCTIDAATARACAADIAGAQRLLEYANELYDNHNC